MCDFDYGFFKSLFLSDFDGIRKCSLSDKDLFLTLPVPEVYDHWQRREVTISAFEILKMSIDAWYSLRGKESLQSLSINPSEFYNSSIKCLAYLEQKFPDQCIAEVPYEKYLHFCYTIGEEEEWYGPLEVAQLVDDGFKKIDIELINAGARRNVKKVISLLNLGANPMVDPEEKTNGSEIIDHLVKDESNAFVQYLNCLNSPSKDEGIRTYEKAFAMLAELYTVASSAKLLRVIEEFGIVDPTGNS
ncbi:hypothetical protein KI659_00080 [Litoribacter alkaliphilus]|uniref:Uncharacterized protein n=1 Tax=Litoribacter ruber TaxID=702568 RepID=A0AAP2CFU4_9BACT|nr:hypothetical protein [Litoribacter alkaliphilus]MBS9522401.1 hypothetical protein [Litoribacter alkaliphilus]